MDRSQPDVLSSDQHQGQQQLPLVVLLHGLLRTRADMNYLARSLLCGNCGDARKGLKLKLEHSLHSTGGYGKTLAGNATRCLTRQVVSLYRS